MNAARATKLLAVAAVVLAALRLPWLAARHARPALNAEAADLQRVMFYHWGLRGHLAWDWWEQVLRDGFKPPLWYGGVPALGAWRTTLDAEFLAWVQAALLVALAVLVWRAASALAGASAGPLAVAAMLAMPGVAGRFTVAGVEPLHAVLLLAWVLTLRRMRAPGVGPPALAGVLLGAGLLAKWSFAAYALGPWLGAAFLSRRDARGLGRLVTAGLIGLATFGAWWFTAADPAAVLAGAGDEPSFPGDPIGALLFYPRVVVTALGAPGLGLSVAGIVAARGLEVRADRRDGALLFAAAAAVLLVHVAVPHKELRYVLPALPMVAALAAAPVARRFATRGVARLGIVAALLLGGVASALVPATGAAFPGDLRLVPNDYDAGLDAVVAHPSFAGRERNVVTYSLDVTPLFPVMTTLGWAFYSRNATVVVGRGNHVDLTERAAAFDLERSTHVVLDRDLGDQERAAIASMGFRPVVERRPIDLGGFPVLSLWALEPGRAPPKRGRGPAPPPP